MSPAQNFSPLFIGEITSTIAWRERRRREEVISVPSSSGKSLQPVERSTLDSSCDSISVPSSSGKSLQPATWYKIGTWSSEFQSPLHRGNHFNHTDPARRPAPPLISVPSSSGKSLQPYLEFDNWAPVSGFQSPLHRGNHFNRRMRVVMDAISQHFSPLFIGEITSTRSLRPPRSSASEISVPSSSGTSLQPQYGSLCRHTRHRDFSPLFIGEITSTPRVSHMGRSTVQNFSPLFIGEITSTWDCLGKGRPELVDFSPLFIGEITSTTRSGGTRRLVPSDFSPLFIGEITSTSNSDELSGGN